MKTLLFCTLIKNSKNFLQVTRSVMGPKRRGGIIGHRFDFYVRPISIPISTSQFINFLFRLILRTLIHKPHHLSLNDQKDVLVLHEGYIPHHHLQTAHHVDLHDVDGDGDLHGVHQTGNV